MYSNILIIGCCGSGKSTLTKSLSKILNLPVVHLDALFWDKNWQQKDENTFLKLLDNELNGDKWIIDGNYISSLEYRASFADTIIYLDYPILLCLFNVIKRIIKYKGRTRSDMASNCPERFDFSFIKYVLNFNRTHKSKIKEILNRQKIPVFVLKRRRDIACLVKQLNDN